MINSIQTFSERRQGLPIAWALHTHFTLRRLTLGLALVLAVVMGGLLGPPGAVAEQEPMPAPAKVAVDVNINTADASAIAESLKGVGQSRAEAIVRYREAYGPFASVDELAEVKGIGQSTLDMNRKRITLE
ncbi:MAG: competence protein ComEA [Bacteroidia bacterium]|jgi:competence protein ComEA